MKNVGVYSVQGDVAENIAALKAASSNGLVKCSINEVMAEQIMNLDALVILGKYHYHCVQSGFFNILLSESMISFSQLCVQLHLLYAHPRAVYLAPLLKRLRLFRQITSIAIF